MRPESRPVAGRAGGQIRGRGHLVAGVGEVDDGRRGGPVLAAEHAVSESEVQRGADDHDDGLGSGGDARIGGGPEATAGQGLAQHLGALGLLEGHDARHDLVDDGLRDVIGGDRQATFGEGDAEREPDVTAAADHDDIEGELW